MKNPLIPIDNKKGREREFFADECQLINAEGMIESEKSILRLPV